MLNSSQPKTIRCQIANLDVEMRQCVPEDGPKVNALYNRVFGLTRTDAMWNWRYVDNPASPETPVGYILAEVDGRVVGQYACLVRDFCVNGRLMPFQYAQDTALDSEFRKGFHFVRRILKTAVDFSSQAGSQIGYGFPNVAHHKIGKKVMGYVDVAQMAQLFRRLNRYLTVRKLAPPLADALKPILRAVSAKYYQRQIRRARAKLSTSLEVRAVDAFDDQADALWERVKMAHPVIGLRDRTYLNWRYVQKPEVQYHRIVASPRENRKMTGYMVLRLKSVEESLVGYIVDFLCEDRKTFDTLLLEALDFFTENQADFCLCMAPPDSQNYKWLSENGFTEKAFTHTIPLVYTLLAGSDDPPLYRNSANWYLTFGETADL